MPTVSLTRRGWIDGYARRAVPGVWDAYMAACARLDQAPDDEDAIAAWNVACSRWCDAVDAAAYFYELKSQEGR